MVLDYFEERTLLSNLNFNTGERMYREIQRL